MKLLERTTGTVTADQAIFTSIRSPMGEGYRIVAASKGVTSDEKREILQYAPSHESLCDSSPNARALACFPLSTRRRCVFLTRAAGLEHTGRGGYRVFTHVLILKPEEMRAFAWDPFALADRIPEFTDEQMKRPPSELAAISIGVANDGSASQMPNGRDAVLTGADVGKALHVVSEALCMGRLLVIGAPEAGRTLRTIVTALPAFVRQRASICFGLKYSPNRKFDFLFSDASATELAKHLRDCPVSVYRWSDTPPATATAWQGWTRFVANRWERRREADLREIGAGLVSECEPIVLDRIAALKLDTERIPVAEQAELAELEKRHAEEVNAAGVYRRYLDAFHHAMEQRRNELGLAETAAETIDKQPAPGRE